MDNDTKLAFARLALKLEPENISFDGELSKSEIEIRKRLIAIEWKELEKKAGCKVTMDEAETWLFQKLARR